MTFDHDQGSLDYEKVWRDRFFDFEAEAFFFAALFAHLAKEAEIADKDDIDDPRYMDQFEEALEEANGDLAKAAELFRESIDDDLRHTYEDRYKAQEERVKQLEKDGGPKAPGQGE